MTDKLPTRPAQLIREALNELLRLRGDTSDRVAGDMFLGRDQLVVRLRRPQVIEGSCQDADRTIDLFDLIEAHRRERGRDG